MSKSGPEKLKMESLDITFENVNKIAGIFPNVVTEIKDESGKVRKGIDFDLLKQELSNNYVEGREERYEFTWVGKKQSIIEGNFSIQKTLRPCIDESKDWENTKNIYIEGDNLEALKLLQESYLNKVKMIYIDPPYNTGNDKLYRDKFLMDIEEYDEETGNVDEVGNRLKKNSKDWGRYHSDWCSILFSRLKLAHTLLKDDGVIFVSIDDNEVHNLRKLMDEIFGEGNFIGAFIWKNKAGGGGKQSNNQASDEIKKKEAFVLDHEYIVVYAKNVDETFRFNEKLSPEEIEQYKNPDNDPRGPYKLKDLEMSMPQMISTMYYDLIDPDGIVIKPRGGRYQWRYSKKRALESIADGSTIWVKLKCDKKIDSREYRYVPKTKQYLFINGKLRTKIARSFLLECGFSATGTREIMNIFSQKESEIPIFSNPKPSRLMSTIIDSVTKGNDLILDFFSGSSTTAHGVMKLNAEDGGERRFIMIQLPEPCNENSEAYKAGFKNISEIGKKRIRLVGEIISKELEAKSQQATLTPVTKKNLDIGFRVFKIDNTNMKDVYYSAAEYSQETIEGLVDNVKENRTDIDLLYQILIDWGLPLDLPHDIEEIDGFHLHIVDKNALIACFDANIPEKVMRKIAGKKPLRAVFRDGSFRSSPGKLNIEGIFKTIAPDTTLRVI